MRSFLFISLFFSVVFAGQPLTKTISATLRETPVRSLEGLNIKMAFPFQFDDYVVGFKHSLADFSKAPEELFVKRTIDLGKDSQLSFDAEYNTGSNVFSLGTQWISHRFGLSVSAEADTKNKLKTVDLSATKSFRGNKVGMALTFDRLLEKISGVASLARDDTVISLNVDSHNQNPELSVGHKLDDRNVIAPCLSLRDGAIHYSWTRRWVGGSMESSFVPGERLSLDWCDAGTNGIWRTRANIPLTDPTKTTVSITRDWKY